MNVITKNRIKSILRQPQPRNIAALSVIVVVSLAGYLAFSTNASGFFAATESDGGTVSGNASTVADSSASGGRALQFNAPAGGGGGTGTTTCPLPKYPSPSCTGVPAGTQLRDLPLNEDGSAFRVDYNTVIDYGGDSHIYLQTDAQSVTHLVLSGVHVPGTLLIGNLTDIHGNTVANDVIVKNSVVDVGITDSDGSREYGPYTVMDTTIGPASGCLLNAGITYSKYTAIRVLIRNLSTGFQVDGVGQATIRDSYARMCGLDATTPDNAGHVAGHDGTHSTGIQACAADNTCQSLTIDHVTFDDRNDYHSGDFEIGVNGGNVVGVSVSNSLAVGSTYPLNIEWSSGTNFTISGNAVANGTWDYAPASTENTCAHQTWSGNKIVNIDANYNVTSIAGDLPCVD